MAFSLLPKVVSICKKFKNTVFLRCFCFPRAAKHRQKVVQNGPEPTFGNILYLLFFFAAPHPQKRKITTCLKDFWGRPLLVVVVVVVVVVVAAVSQTLLPLRAPPALVGVSG